jgi:hypothetical protein
VSRGRDAARLHAEALAAYDRGDYALARRRLAATLAALRGARELNESAIATTLTNLGAATAKTGDLAAARQHLEAALAIDPSLAAARHRLATVLQATGEAEEAQRQRAIALRQQPVFVEEAPDAVRTVVIVASDELGNIPLDHLLPPERNRRIWWFIAYAAEAAGLPERAVIFNAIADPDMPGMTPEAQAALARLNRRVLNPPGRVACTRRDRLAGLLAGIPGVVVPEIWRGRWVERGATNMTLPLLVRPAGQHGGVGLQLVATDEQWATLDFAADEVVYVTRFHDYRSADGYWRKYRMIFVDRRSYPYHLAISPNWLVHYFSAEMTADWKLQEERRFLADPAAVLGEHAMATIAEIARRIDLDYCGIDFTLLPDGRVLVFEANATMLVHPEAPSGPLAFKNPYVETIVAAFEAMLATYPS